MFEFSVPRLIHCPPLDWSQVSAPSPAAPVLMVTPVFTVTTLCWARSDPLAAKTIAPPPVIVCGLLPNPVKLTIGPDGGEATSVYVCPARSRPCEKELIVFDVVSAERTYGPSARAVSKPHQKHVVSRMSIPPNAYR